MYLPNTRAYHQWDLLPFVVRMNAKHMCTSQAYLLVPDSHKLQGGEDMKRQELLDDIVGTTTRQLRNIAE